MRAEAFCQRERYLSRWCQTFGAYDTTYDIWQGWGLSNVMEFNFWTAEASQFYWQTLNTETSLLPTVSFIPKEILYITYKFNPLLNTDTPTR